MKVLVTGGAGAVGRSAVARLIGSGHEVTVIGRRPDREVDGGIYQVCDINDYASLRQQVRGMERIVHLAALPHPYAGPAEQIFQINGAGTFNVYQAAAEEGIKRVVSASSINAFGYNFGLEAFPLRYFPIDEEHPGVTTDPYSFSKQIMEEIGAYFWRREGISSIFLRLPFVAGAGRGEGMIGRIRASYRELMALPDAERQERVRELMAVIERRRKARRKRERPAGPPNWDEMRRVFGITDFWAIIRAEDSAQAIEKGLLADFVGSHPLYVNHHLNVTGVESEALIRLFYPEVQERKRPLVGDAALVSIERARELIGFEPEHPLES
jgi:nucleoside-diphosphate-sugar epimerase